MTYTRDKNLAGGGKEYNEEDHCIAEYWLEEFACFDNARGMVFSEAYDCRKIKMMCEDGACVPPPEPTTRPTSGPTTGPTTSQSFGTNYGPVPNAIDYEIETALTYTFASSTTYTTQELSYIVTGLAPSTKYYLRVRGCNAAGCGPWSSYRTVTTFPLPPAGSPSIPSSFNVQMISATSSTLTWNDVIGETSYQIYRSIYPFTSYSRIKTLTGTADSPTTGDCYCQGADTDKDSDVDLNDLGILSSNYGKTDCSFFDNYCEGADVDKDGDVDLSDQGTFATYYGRNDCNNLGCPAQVSYTDNALSSSYNYYYRIRACNLQGCGDYTLPVFARFI